MHHQITVSWKVDHLNELAFCVQLGLAEFMSKSNIMWYVILYDAFFDKKQIIFLNVHFFLDRKSVV